MKIKKPKFWYDKNLISYFFFPFSLITNLINFDGLLVFSMGHTKRN